MASRKPEAPRAWQRMLSGRRLDLLDPSPMDIEIEDIAHGLARVARWNGQTTGEHPMSVAQHSVVVEEIVAHLEPSIDARWRLAALLHDAAEYVIGDMISPFKAALGLDYQAFEDRLGRCHPHPVRPASSRPGQDQGADQGGRPRLRLLRGDPTGRLRNGRGAASLRSSTARLRPAHRNPAAGRGAGAVRSPSSHALRSSRLHQGRGGVRDRVNLQADQASPNHAEPRSRHWPFRGHRRAPRR